MVQHHFRKNACLTHFAPIFCSKTAHFKGILGFSMGENALVAHKGLKTRALASQVVQDHL